MMYFPTPQEQALQKAAAQKQQQQQQQRHHNRHASKGATENQDPFKVFDKVMKDEFGRDYKAKKAWKGSEAVKDLSSINKFVKKNENAQREFKKLDVDKSKTLSKAELSKYISQNGELWKQLSRSLDLSEAKCIAIATDVAFACAVKKEDAMNTIEDRDLTAKEFKRFHKKYIADVQGAHDFFLRTIFATFDVNHDGVLSVREMDRFLDIFYKSRSIFRGSMSLPDRQTLNESVRKKCDLNNDGALEFSEIRDLLILAAAVTVDK